MNEIELKSKFINGIEVELRKADDDSDCLSLIVRYHRSVTQEDSIILAQAKAIVNPNTLCIYHTKSDWLPDLGDIGMHDVLGPFDDIKDAEKAMLKEMVSAYYVTCTNVMFKVIDGAIMNL